MAEEGLAVTLAVKPGMRREGLDFVREAEGRLVLGLRVAAPPREGAANAAACTLLARLLDVPPSRLRLIRGARSRMKHLFIAGDPVQLRARLAALAAAASAASGAEGEAR